MKWLFRPSVVILVSVALALCAVALVFWPLPGQAKAVPQKLEAGDQEIVWLYAATNAGPWERLVTAVKSTAAGDLSPLGLEVNADNAFPSQTTAIPELAISAPNKKGRLWFRWYKLTSEQKTEDWVRALLARKPAPLAIIGGSSSDLAIQLALALRSETSGEGAPRPLLLLTTATADDVSPTGPLEAHAAETPLNRIYAGRTFRYCFTNRQIAEAVTDFIWGRNDIVPDAAPVYLTWWMDDPYSKDLNKQFGDTLSRQLPQSALPISESVFYSIGTFDRPNPWETQAATRLVKAKLERHSTQKRPLLVLPATTLPARRFLRALVRAAPAESRKFVVAMGDGISFNTVYRDRNVAWHIQDLPFPLVFFAHRDPVSTAAGFPLEKALALAESTDTDSPAAGTDDLLLFADIVETLVWAACDGRSLESSADSMEAKLRRARWLSAEQRVSLSETGSRLFDADGNRQSGAGEHVVLLLPGTSGKQVLPRAEIEIFGKVGPRNWKQEAALAVHYDGYEENAE